MTVKIITIFGLFFQFISFWLAAPEILGVEWLKKTENILKKLISQIPNYILIVFGIIIGIVLSESVTNFYWLLIVATLLILITFLQKKIEMNLEKKISGPLLNKLIGSNTLRFTLLKFAAAFFTLGFVLQIIAVILS